MSKINLKVPRLVLIERLEAREKELSTLIATRDSAEKANGETRKVWKEAVAEKCRSLTPSEVRHWGNGEVQLCYSKVTTPKLGKLADVPKVSENMLKEIQKALDLLRIATDDVVSTSTMKGLSELL